VEGGHVGRAAALELHRSAGAREVLQGERLPRRATHGDQALARAARTDLGRGREALLRDRPDHAVAPERRRCVPVPRRQGGRRRLGQLQPQARDRPRRPPTLHPERPHRARQTPGFRQRRRPAAHVERLIGLVHGPGCGGPTVGHELVEPRAEARGELATHERTRRVRRERRARRLRRVEPLPVAPQPDIPEAAPRQLHREPLVGLHLDPPGALLQIRERGGDVRRIGEQRRPRTVHLHEGAGGHAGFPRPRGIGVYAQPIGAALEERVHPPVGAPGLPRHLAGPRHAVDELHRGPLRARRRERVAPEARHGQIDRAGAGGGNGVGRGADGHGLGRGRLGRRRRRAGPGREREDAEREAEGPGGHACTGGVGTVRRGAGHQASTHTSLARHVPPGGAPRAGRLRDAPRKIHDS
jgi:hypothetical protein